MKDEKTQKEMLETAKKKFNNGLDGRYNFIVGAYSMNYETGEKGYQGNTFHTSITSNSIPVLHEAAKVLNIKTYAITENEVYGEKEDAYFGSSNKRIYATDDILEFEKQEKEKKETFDKKQKERAERINSLPEYFEAPSFFPTVLEFYRTPAEYRPSYSKSIQGGGIYLRRKPDGKTINLEGYQTADNKFLLQQFISDSEINFGKGMLIPDKATAKMILTSLFDRRKEIKEIIRKI